MYISNKVTGEFKILDKKDKKVGGDYLGEEERDFFLLKRPKKIFEVLNENMKKNNENIEINSKKYSDMVEIEVSSHLNEEIKNKKENNNENGGSFGDNDVNDKKINSNNDNSTNLSKKKSLIDDEKGRLYYSFDNKKQIVMDLRECDFYKVEKREKEKNQKYRSITKKLKNIYKENEVERRRILMKIKPKTLHKRKNENIIDNNKNIGSISVVEEEEEKKKEKYKTCLIKYLKKKRIHYKNEKPIHNQKIKNIRKSKNTNTLINNNNNSIVSDSSVNEIKNSNVTDNSNSNFSISFFSPTKKSKFFTPSTKKFKVVHYLPQQEDITNNSLIDSQTTKKRKFKPDDIRKKIKSRFHKSLKQIINENLRKSGSKYEFDFLPQFFISSISREKNQEVLDLTYQEILGTDFVSSLDEKKYKNKNVDYLKIQRNKKVLQYLKENPDISKKSGFDVIGKMKYSELLNEYFLSEEFEKSVNKLKEENEDDDYIKEYLIKARNYVNFFRQKPKSKIKNFFEENLSYDRINLNEEEEEEKGICGSDSVLDDEEDENKKSNDSRRMDEINEGSGSSWESLHKYKRIKNLSKWEKSDEEENRKIYEDYLENEEESN